MQENLKKNIENMIKRGTSIVSFTYDGKRRNAVIGIKRAMQGTPKWGFQTSRAIRNYRNEDYLVCQMNNDGPFYPIKTFKISKISNPSRNLLAV